MTFPSLSHFQGPKKLPDVFLIGGDAAGMSAASRAKRNQAKIEVTVLEQTEDVSYSACGMPYNIANPNRSMDDLVVRSAPVFREKQGIDLKTGHRYGIYCAGDGRGASRPGSKTILVNMVGDRTSGRLLGVQMVGEEGVAHRINAPAVALHAGMTVDEFSQSDLAYAPPFSPVWDPMLTAANQLLKKLQPVKAK